MAGAYAFDESDGEDDEDETVGTAVTSAAVAAATPDVVSVFSPVASTSEERFIFPPA